MAGTGGAGGAGEAASGGSGDFRGCSVSASDFNTGGQRACRHALRYGQRPRIERDFAAADDADFKPPQLVVRLAAKMTEAPDNRAVKSGDGDERRRPHPWRPEPQARACRAMQRQRLARTDHGRASPAGA
jgi:hypothetical protein